MKLHELRTLGTYRIWDSLSIVDNLLLPRYMWRHLMGFHFDFVREFLVKTEADAEWGPGGIDSGGSPLGLHASYINRHERNELQRYRNEDRYLARWSLIRAKQRLDQRHGSGKGAEQLSMSPAQSSSSSELDMFLFDTGKLFERVMFLLGVEGSPPSSAIGPKTWMFEKCTSFQRTRFHFLFSLLTGDEDRPDNAVGYAPVHKKILASAIGKKTTTVPSFVIVSPEPEHWDMAFLELCEEKPEIETVWRSSLQLQIAQVFLLDLENRRLMCPKTLACILDEAWPSRKRKEAPINTSTSDKKKSVTAFYRERGHGQWYIAMGRKSVYLDHSVELPYVQALLRLRPGERLTAMALCERVRFLPRSEHLREVLDFAQRVLGRPLRSKDGIPWTQVMDDRYFRQLREKYEEAKEDLNEIGTSVTEKDLVELEDMMKQLHNQFRDIRTSLANRATTAIRRAILKIGAKELESVGCSREARQLTRVRLTPEKTPIAYHLDKAITTDDDYFYATKQPLVWETEDN